MIKRICKQCGKEFTLNDSEIKFYKEKNLDLPKRCSECRKENKNNKDDLNNTYNFGYNETSAANCLIKSNGQNIKITYLLEDDFDPNFGIKSNKYESYDEYIKNGETGFLSPISILFDEDTKIAIVKIEEYK